MGEYRGGLLALFMDMGGQERQERQGRQGRIDPWKKPKQYEKPEKQFNTGKYDFPVFFFMETIDKVIKLCYYI